MIEENTIHLMRIIEQHTEETAFLWLLRNNAITEAHYNLTDLKDLEERIEAHIDGLRIAGKTGYQLCLDNLKQFKEAGEMFAAATLAFESNDLKRLQILYDMAESNPETEAGLISALGWVEPQHLQGKVSGMLSSANPFWQRIGITACAIHRVNPRKYLKAALNNTDRALCCRALKAIGELGCIDLHKDVRRCMQSDNAKIQFWAAWASILLGQRGKAVHILESMLIQAVTPDNQKNIEKSAQLLFRISTPQQTQDLLSTLVKQHNNLRLAIQAVGISGNSHYIPWLIQQMAVPEFARVAGEAFSLITGIDLAYNDLERDQPKDFHTGPTESPDDENTALDKDENLPWPDPALIQQWWQQHQNEFIAEKRYLIGKQVSKEHCQQVLKLATQRQRYAAALELALMSPEAMLFETRARAKQQFQLLIT